MAPRSWRHTVDIECRDFPAGTATSDVVQWVWDFFANSYPDFKVASIQQSSGRVARVTFDKECIEGKEVIENLGEVTINGVQCLVLKPEPSAPASQNVLVYQYPFEFPNEAVASFLGKFGAVKNVSHQHWTNLPNVCTGTRIVRMVIDKDIPRFIFVRGIRCKVWYRDQPLTCDICSKGGHKASACPDKGKCLRCHSPGHVARHCPTPWGSAGGSNNVAAAASESGAAGAVEVVPPVSVDPDSVLPPGDLSQGLQHAEDLDAGFPQLAAGDLSEGALATAASVAEVVLNTFGLQSDDMSAPEVVVVDEGAAPCSDSSPTLLDDRFNQLDEFCSQRSVSILSNCGPGGAPPGGEFVNGSQINNDVSFNVGNNNDNVTNSSNDSDSLLNVSSDNVNCYGSIVASDGAPPGPSIVDSVMTPASDPRKRPVSESSSDDASGSLLGPNSKNLTKKTKNSVPVASSAQSKKGVVLNRLPGAVASVLQPRKGGGVASATQTKNRLPRGVSDAARLAIARKK